MDLSLTLSENLKGKIIIEFPIFRVVPKTELDDIPLVGSTIKIQKKIVKGETECKRSKMTFYEISEGELSDSS